MKLHQDGTLEGTPEEIAAFMKLRDPMLGKMYVPLANMAVTTARVGCRSITHERVKGYEEMLLQTE